MCAHVGGKKKPVGSKFNSPTPVELNFLDACPNLINPISKGLSLILVHKYKQDDEVLTFATSSDAVFLQHSPSEI